MSTWRTTASIARTGPGTCSQPDCADLWGRRKLYAAGTAVFTVCSLLCGLSTARIRRHEVPGGDAGLGTLSRLRAVAGGQGGLRLRSGALHAAVVAAGQLGEGTDPG